MDGKVLKETSFNKMFMDGYDGLVDIGEAINTLLGLAVNWGPLICTSANLSLYSP